ncbi:hypothetical protein OC846_001625 [Tilletia horrida]|uniref:GATA-type domain-containing protein n=1 Tax=Tilletia horrida TaxID=155126 RepID=A0AAN6JTM5_9BASI|nr:hypothetical protein OC846_001625 [Tilletia horrida]KAK0568561.1 hypothetical protein OC861_001809 [Tilletia horrida]
MSAPSTPTGRRERPNWSSANSLLTHSLDALRTAVAAEAAFDASTTALQNSQQLAREREQVRARLEQDALEAERIAAEAARRAASRRAAAQQSEEELQEARLRVETSQAEFEDRRRAFNHWLSELRTSVDAAGIAIGTHDPHPLEPKADDDDRSGTTGPAQQENQPATNGRANGPSSFFSALASRFGHGLLHPESSRSEEPTSSGPTGAGTSSSQRRASSSSGDRLSSNLSPSASALIRRGHSGPGPSTSSSQSLRSRMTAPQGILFLHQGRGAHSTSSSVGTTAARAAAPRIHLPSSAASTSRETVPPSSSPATSSIALSQPAPSSSLAREHDGIALSSTTAPPASIVIAEVEMVQITTRPLGPTSTASSGTRVESSHHASSSLDPVSSGQPRPDRRQTVVEVELPIPPEDGPQYDEPMPPSGSSDVRQTGEPAASTPRKRTFHQAQSADSPGDFEDSTSGQQTSPSTAFTGTDAGSPQQATRQMKRSRTEMEPESAEASVSGRGRMGQPTREEEEQHDGVSTRQTTDRSSQGRSRAAAAGIVLPHHPMRLRSSSPTGELLCLDERNEASTSTSGPVRTASGSASHDTSSGTTGSTRSCSECGTKTTSSWKHRPKATIRDDGIVAVTEGAESKGGSSSHGQAERPLLCQACYMRVRRELVREHVQQLSPTRRGRPRQTAGEQSASHASASGSGSGSNSRSVVPASSEDTAEHREEEESDPESSDESRSGEEEEEQSDEQEH